MGKIFVRLVFLVDVTVDVTVDICCFSGSSRTVNRRYTAGDVISKCNVVRGPKQKGGRVLEVYIDNGTLHPDRFEVPEKSVEVRECQ